MQPNLGGLLAWEFLLFHWVEVRRWQDIRNHHSVDEDPIFKGNKVPNEEMGYPGKYPPIYLITLSLLFLLCTVGISFKQELVD